MTAMNKTLFIDFDGTLADRGQIPPAHLGAVRVARAAGHRVFLCTGRAKVMVPRQFRESLFDGLVCAAGGYVEIDGEVLADVRFPPDLAAAMAATLSNSQATFLLEAPDRIYCTPGSAQRMDAAFADTFGPGDGPAGWKEFIDAIQVEDDLTDCSFSKVSVLHAPLPVTEYAAAVGPEIGTLPNSVTGLSGHAGELYLRGVHKAVGIAVVERHLGLRRTDIIAIGDGHNDIEMLEYAGVGVAVAEAPPEVLAVAQHVVPGPAAAGLVRGFAELGLTPEAEPA
ncbi:MAG: HAD hydrolase family protein [Propionibacteriaceae bacterium]|nr:HAD hydrolase family protein [Propionibacteriaceae bacterium]